MPFQPQLSQEDLAQMIDREGLDKEFESLHKQGQWYRADESQTAVEHLRFGGQVRLAPGARTDFGLLPPLHPHNPDGLTADVITEGGLYRAVTLEELDGRHGIYSGTGVAEHWTDGKWWKGAFANTGKGTHRVPISTPFPKVTKDPACKRCEDEGTVTVYSEEGIEYVIDCPDCSAPELDSALDAVPPGGLEKMLDEAAPPSPIFKRGDRVTKVSGGCWTGLVVGTYSTELTPEGYAVESENEPGSVQIYPAKALRLAPATEPSSAVQRETPKVDEPWRAKLREKLEEIHDGWGDAADNAREPMPRLEAVLAKSFQEDDGDYLTEDLHEHAYQLETERNAANALLEKARETLFLIHGGGQGNEVFPPNPMGGNITSEEWASLIETLKEITNHLKK